MTTKLILSLTAATAMLTGVAFADHLKGDQSMRTGELLGTTVVDQSGQTIGQLKDIVMHPQSGLADLAIVSLRMPERVDKLTAVPWQLVQVTDGHRLMLNTDRATLLSATVFEGGRWPQFDTAYNERIYSHYGLT